MKYRYPRENIYEFFENKQVNNWRDVVKILSDYFRSGEQNMTVGQSSSWAICQEFLGNLEGYDLLYARERDGIWSTDTSIEWIDGFPHVSVNTIAIRDVITDIFEQFPE